MHDPYEKEEGQIASTAKAVLAALHGWDERTTTNKMKTKEQIEKLKQLINDALVGMPGTQYTGNTNLQIQHIYDKLVSKIIDDTDSMRLDMAQQLEVDMAVVDDGKPRLVAMSRCNLDKLIAERVAAHPNNH